MKNQIIYIDFDRGTLADAQGGSVMGVPTLQMGAEPVWEIHFQSFEQGSLPDMTDAVSWRAAIDTDFLSATTPMVRSFDIDASSAASGIIKVPLNTNTETFISKVDGQNAIGAYFELYGLDSEAKVIYDYRFSIACRGTIDYQGGEPLPVVSGGVTLADVYALLRAGYECSFSSDGVNWHDDQVQGDTYYRTRYPGGEWSEPINLYAGTDGITPQLSIGTVTTLTTGSPASEIISGETSELVLDLGLPAGIQGISGVTPQFTAVNTTTLAPNIPASAEIIGDAASLTLNLGVPKGDIGISPDLDIGTVTTLPTGTPASAIISGTTPNLTLNLGLPKGDTGTASYLHIAYASDASGADFSYAESDVLSYRSEVVTDTTSNPPSTAFTTWVKYKNDPLQAIISTNSTSFEVGKVYSCSISQNATIAVTGMKAGFSGLTEVFLTVTGSPNISLASGLSYYLDTITGSCHLIIQTTGTTGKVYVL